MAAIASDDSTADHAAPLLRIETELGAISIEVHAALAPKTAAYVVALISAGVFADASFYRSTRLANERREPLIQGGPLAPYFTGSGGAVPPIALLDVIETTDDTGLHHGRGAVWLARDLNRTGHVLPELFVCLDDYPELDSGGRSHPDSLGFPVFATVTEGLAVVDAIARGEVEGTSTVDRLVGEILTAPVPFTSSFASAEHQPDPLGRTTP